jgi:hypothetical protein
VQGIVTVSVYYRGVYYVVVSDGATEQPLLDSRFPNVSDKGRGYQLKSYPDGRDTFKELRKGKHHVPFLDYTCHL